jgi:hypothetical protein
MELGGQYEMVEREAQKVCTQAPAAELSSATAKRSTLARFELTLPKEQDF